MFSKKPQIDIKKSLQKFLDIKKDSFSRLKHLKVIIDNAEIKEMKDLFEHQFSHIYHIFFESFISLDASLKQKGNKVNKEDLDCVFIIFEKILTLVPELLKKRCQSHSIATIMRKLLHHGNSIKIRQEGMRFFLIWYQILGEAATNEIEQIYLSLVPGIIPGIHNYFISNHNYPINKYDSHHNIAGTIYNDTDAYVNDINNELNGAFTFQPVTVEPFMPIFASENQPKDITCYYLQCLLDYMISQISKIYWKDQCEVRQMKCFEFLLEMFRIKYLPYIFLSLQQVNLYRPFCDLPDIRIYNEDVKFDGNRLPNCDTLINCESVVIQWLTKYLRNERIDGLKERIEENSLQNRQSQIQQNFVNSSEHIQEWRDPTAFEYNVFRSIFNSSRIYVNLMHSIFHQTFLLPFDHSVTMRKVISLYRDWIAKSSNNLPLFLEEPSNQNSNSLTEIRAGTSNLLRVFVTIASNVFLLELPPSKIILLEEQVDISKRVLNIYRFMVMNIDMDKATWEQLLNVLLQIISLVLKENVPLRKEDTLGGRLAPALFQTLIVTWIKANLNVTVSTLLWEKLHVQLSSLTKWEELVKEWCKTMDTLTRVMSRYVYNINLNDLPLERSTERMKKKSRGMRMNEDGEMKSAVLSNVSSNLPNNKAAENKSNQTNLKRIRSNSGDTPLGTNSTRTTSKFVANKILRSRSESDVSVLLSKYKLKSNLIDDMTSHYEKCRSLEFYKRIESPIWSESSVSRSPSPSSNVTESSSLKESPMNIEAHNSNALNNTNSKSVLIGGNYKGWCSESSIILWRRMLGILDDINKITDPTIHSFAMECLAKITEDLIKVRENICSDINSSSSLIPPIHFISSWLFKATQLPNEFKTGKLLAYKLLCLLTVRKNDFELSKEYLALFYKTVHQGLSSFDMDITSAIVKYSGPKFFSLGLPGSSCLVFDFINAANSIVSSTENKLPRCEALYLLGSLIGFHSIFSNILVLQPRTSQTNLMHYKDTKDHILDILISSSKKEHTGLGRSIALNSLGIFLYQELQSRSNHQRLREITSILISGTRVSLKKSKNNDNSNDSNSFKFNNRVLCRIACDMLRLQCDHATYLLDNHPEIPKRIIEGLCTTLISHYIMVKQQNLIKEYKNTLLTIMFCLGQWFMSVPKLFLQCTKSDNSDKSLMLTILEVLSNICFDNNNSESRKSLSQNPDQKSDFNVNNMIESGLTPTVTPTKRTDESKQIDDTKDNDVKTVKLAADLLIGYFVNYFGLFPQNNLGSSILSCFINENDDNYHAVNADTLDLDTFNAPNVLFFIMNNSSIVSFIELPSQQTNESEEYEISKVNVTMRIIVRNLIGKFAWDCKQLHSESKEKFNDSKKLWKKMSFDDEENQLNSRNLRESDDFEDDDIKCQPDELELLVQHLKKTSPECINNYESKKSNGLNSYPEAADMIALLTNQHFQESRFVEKSFQKFRQYETDSQTHSLNDFAVANSSFQHCRQLIDQLGFLFWEKRNRIDLLSKNQNVVREIRHLDNQRCRETHKFAVIYVGKGQEDKKSILLNSAGSRAFEEFVTGLGWEVNLETHLGFRGGLQQNNSTGKSTPYYANAFVEVIYHVSTRISCPNETENETITKKMRHIGNDEIFIVWSEHTKDYRRGIIPTEFCDALIVIYPLKSYSGLYYIQVTRKPEVPFIGPLFTGAVVHHDVLPGLVRATAINASRAKRMHIPYYLNYFEERARSFEEISKNYKEKSCFEDFSAKIHSPKELDVIFSRPFSSLSSINDTISISSNLANFSGSLPQTPQTKTRPLSMSIVEQKMSNKTCERPVSAASQQSNSPIGLN